MPIINKNLSYEEIKYKYAIGETALLTCMLVDEEHPELLPIIGENVWIAIQKSGTEDWANFINSDFSAADPESLEAKLSMTSHQDGTYEALFNPEDFGEEAIPESYIVRFYTDYDFGEPSSFYIEEHIFCISA